MKNNNILIGNLIQYFIQKGPDHYVRPFCIFNYKFGNCTNQIAGIKNNNNPSGNLIQYFIQKGPDHCVRPFNYKFRNYTN